jgi:phage replication O-like protein O
MTQSYNTPSNKAARKNEKNSEKEILDKKTPDFLENNYKFPFPNHTQTPNDFFDYIVPMLKEGELRIMLFLIRQTYGWHKNWEKITFEQIAKGTGMIKRTCISTIKSLTKKRLIEKRQEGPVNHVENYYHICMEDDSNNVSECFKNTPGECFKNTPGRRALKKYERYSNIQVSSREVDEPKNPETPPSSASTTAFSKVKKKGKQQKPQIWLTDHQKMTLRDKLGDKMANAKIKNAEDLMRSEPTAYTNKSPYQDILDWGLKDQKKKSSRFIKKSDTNEKSEKEKSLEEVKYFMEVYKPPAKVFRWDEGTKTAEIYIISTKKFEKLSCDDPEFRRKLYEWNESFRVKKK